MSTPELAELGPAPFRFMPSQVHDSPAFTPVFKLLTIGLLLSCAGWLAALWNQGALGSGSSSGLIWFMTALGLMLYTGWHILRSHTQLDQTRLHQSWVWDKQLELRELAYCKLIRIRGLEWLIAPRLYARTLLGKFAVFYAADAILLADFERLVKELSEFRRMG